MHFSKSTTRTFHVRRSMKKQKKNNTSLPICNSSYSCSAPAPVLPAMLLCRIIAFSIIVQLQSISSTTQHHGHHESYFFFCQGTPLPAVSLSSRYERQGLLSSSSNNNKSLVFAALSRTGNTSGAFTNSIELNMMVERDEEEKELEEAAQSIVSTTKTKRRRKTRRTRIVEGQEKSEDENEVQNCSSSSESQNKNNKNNDNDDDEKNRNENDKAIHPEIVHQYMNNYIQQHHDSLSSTTTSSSSPSSSASLWPPWPFSLLIKSTNRSMNSISDTTTTTTSSSTTPSSSLPVLDKSAALLFMTYLRQKAIIGLRQMQQVASALSFHLPPASPPIFLLAILPTQATSSTSLLTSDIISKQSTKEIMKKVAKNTLESSSTSTTPSSSNILPFANVIARKLALASLGVAILSWADHEVRKKKRLTPLPMFYYSSLMNDNTRTNNNKNGDNVMKYYGRDDGAMVTVTTRDLKNIILPPFLPEEVTIEEYDDGSQNDDDDDDQRLVGNTNPNDRNKQQERIRKTSEDESVDEEDSIPSTPSTLTPSAMKQQIHDFYQSTIPILPRPKAFISIIESWIKMNQIRKQQEKNMKRQLIMEELIALQKLKKERILNNQKYWRNNNGNGSRSSWYTLRNPALKGMPTVSSDTNAVAPLGYALITGASRGLGRAFAVELARYEVPLILIARDGDKLSSLAQDIQAAYGVPCIIIKADLSKHGTARKIYETTKKAGLHVDILINNAGVCTTKELVQSNEVDIERMMNVNVGSTTMLSHLYARDMKDAKRGRILFVSSMVGAVPSGPGVATYAASKAYEKSLSQSMGRELEKYGVGVTCLMPGAVKDTSFAVRSNANEALCFKVPFYPLKAQNVVSRGVRALLLSGDGEVVPGWHNRIFLKILMPILPPRLTSSIVGLAWSPFRLPWTKGSHDNHYNEVNQLGNNKKYQIESNQQRLKSILNGLPPRQLEIEGQGQQRGEKLHDLHRNAYDNDDIHVNLPTVTSTNEEDTDIYESLEEEGDEKSDSDEVNVKENIESVDHCNITTSNFN